ncbi:MAG: hypothetical protein CBE43_05185 [Rhodopirellula sp. TMED283]|nr:MAG: hypothetical protein CBE43_05185 [Rhodopirellula sp. TMED283]
MLVQMPLALILKKNCLSSGDDWPAFVTGVEGVPCHRVFTLTALNFAASLKASLTAGVDPCILFWLPLRDPFLSCF